MDDQALLKPDPELNTTAGFIGADFNFDVRSDLYGVIVFAGPCGTTLWDEEIERCTRITDIWGRKFNKN